VVVVDQLARGCTVALLLMMGLVLLRARPRAAVAWTTCGLFASIASYLVLSSPDFGASPILTPLLQGIALATPATFLFFTRAFFGDDDRLDARDAAVLAVVIAVGFGRPAAVAQVLYYLASVTLVGLALAQVLRGFSGDLVEPRRGMRAVFTIIVGVEILIVLGAELWLGNTPASRELEVIKSIAALGVTLAFALWLLTPRGDLVAIVSARSAPAAPSSVEPPDADARFRDGLLATMHGEQLYKQEGLTIGGLAQKLGIPEVPRSTHHQPATGTPELQRVPERAADGGGMPDPGRPGKRACPDLQFGAGSRVRVGRPLQPRVPRQDRSNPDRVPADSPQVSGRVH
jgi:hypothetical protein